MTGKWVGHNIYNTREGDLASAPFVTMLKVPDSSTLSPPCFPLSFAWYVIIKGLKSKEKSGIKG